MFNVRMLLVSVLLFVFCCPFASYAESDEDAMMANAKSHYQSGGYYFATTWLERILKNWPDTPQREEVLLMMANAYAATGRDEKALRTVKTLLKEFPQSKGKLDPSVLKFVEEVQARKAGTQPSTKPVALPSTSTPTAKATAEPAPAPAAPAAADVATKVSMQPPPAAPVVAPAKAEVAAPPVAPVPEPVHAKVETAEPPKAAAASAESVAVKIPVEVNAPAKAEVATPPVEPVTKPIPSKLETAEPSKNVSAPPDPVVAKTPEVPVVAKTPAEATAPAKVDVSVHLEPSVNPASAKVETAEPPKVPPAPAEPVVPKNSVEVIAPARMAAGTPMEESCKPGSYTLELGEYVGLNRLVGAKKAVRKAGLVPVVGPGPKKAEMMLRIQVGEFADSESADKLVKKLRGMNADHFVLKDKAGTYRVYAGSYFDKDPAAREQRRLAAQGIKSDLRQVNVPVPSFVLSAGCFPSEEAARGKMAELEQLGLKGKGVRLPKR